MADVNASIMQSDLESKEYELQGDPCNYAENHQALVGEHCM